MIKKRNIASWVLLAVFVPMLVLSSLHIHHVGGEDDCVECVDHHCHGHLGQLATNSHQCVLCQFLTLSFVSATAIAVVYYKNVRSTFIAHRQRIVIIDACRVPSLRAPPCDF